MHRQIKRTGLKGASVSRYSAGAAAWLDGCSAWYALPRWLHTKTEPTVLLLLGLLVMLLLGLLHPGARCLIRSGAIAQCAPAGEQSVAIRNWQGC